MKNLSFRWRLFLMFILVIGIGIAAVVVFISSNMNATVRTNEGKEMFDRVNRMKVELQQYYDANKGWEDVQTTVEQIGRLNGVRILLVDSNFIVGDSEKSFIGIAYNPSDPPDLMKPTDNMTEPGQKPPNGVLFVSKVQEGKLTLLPMPFPARPAPEGKPPQGEPGPGGWEDLRAEQIDQVRNSINWAVLWSVLLGIGLAGFITFFWSRSFTRPIQSLALAARKLAKGDLSQRVNVKSKDEVGELARDFNQMAADLERTDKLRKNMVADIAHELRTPLSNIRGYIEGICDGVIQVDEEVKEYIYGEAMLLTRLVEDLHELALAEAGELRLSLHTEDIKQIAGNSFKALQPKMAAKKIESKLELTDKPTLSDVDRERIAQVLRNLLVNAINYTPEGGIITVSVERRDGEIEVGVTDTGIGIPPAELPLVFERFYRVDKARARTSGGTGLGLTIASQLVKAHKGRIWVESELNKGTCFHFSLPAQDSGTTPGGTVPN